MRTAIVAFILINIAFSNAVFLKKPSTASYNVINQLKSYEESQFGRQILDTIALQLKNKAPMEEVAKLLHDLEVQMKTDALKDEQDNRARDAQCKTTQSELNDKINDATTRLENAQQALGFLRTKKSQLEGKIRNFEAQIRILTNQESSLIEQRKQDEEDFRRRQEEGPKVAEAIELIIQKLKSITPETPAEEAMIQLAKIGANNPILSLAQVASTFSKDRLDHVISKMEELRASLEASLVDDKENEQEEINKYNALLAEIRSTLQNITAELTAAREELKQTDINIANEEDKEQKALRDKAAAETALHESIETCDAAQAAYEARSKRRANELRIIQEVTEFLATKFSTMDGYLKERVNVDRA